MGQTHAVYFDTLVYANKLKAAGVASPQAEAQAETLAEIFDDHIATKQDIETLRADMSGLKDDMDAFRVAMKQDMEVKFAKVDIKFAEVNTRFAELKAEMIKWGVGISAAQAALVVSMLKFFH